MMNHATRYATTPKMMAPGTIDSTAHTSLGRVPVQLARTDRPVAHGIATPTAECRFRFDLLAAAAAMHGASSCGEGGAFNHQFYYVIRKTPVRCSVLFRCADAEHRGR